MTSGSAGAAGAASAAPSLSANAHPALYDEATGVLLTLSVPDPVMPEKERGNQSGHKPGSLGHVLPGLAVRAEGGGGGGLSFSRLLPHTEAEVLLSGVALDEEGFVVPAGPVPTT